jgi:hypothetical protein
MKKLLLALALFASSAQATPHTFTGTIDTPAVLTWMDASGAAVAPYAVYAASFLYVDSTTGYVWALRDMSMPAPYADGIYEAYASDLGLVFTATNCTGTAYLNASTPIPGAVRVSASNGQLYATGAAASVTGHSRLAGGNCYPDTVSVSLFEAIGPLTAPSVPMGPWHLEAK